MRGQGQLRGRRLTSKPVAAKVRGDPSLAKAETSTDDARSTKAETSTVRGDPSLTKAKAK